MNNPWGFESPPSHQRFAAARSNPGLPCQDALLNVTEPLDVRIDPRRLVRGTFWLCLAFELGLVVLDYTVNWNQGSSSAAIRRLCNITREDGLQNWFSVLLLIADAAVLWAMQLLVRRPSGSTARGVNWRRVGWVALALFFTYMAADDAAQIHERVGTAMEKTVATATSGTGLLSDFKSYPWQFVFLPFFGGFGLFMLVFGLKEFGSRRLLALMVAGVTCWVIAVVLDHIEGFGKETDGKNQVYDWVCAHFVIRHSTVEHFSKSIEEFLEMFGATLFLAAFLARLTRVSEAVTVRFAPAPRPADRASPSPAAPPAR